MAKTTQTSAAPLNQGTSFKDLIGFTTGKSDATRADFESAMASRGYSARDVHKLGKAFERTKESGNEYILHPESGFNVYDKGTGTQKTGSGKAKGNKKGADLGDLLGLGNDVSLLAGALRNEKGAYEKSKEPTAETPVAEPFVAEEKSKGQGGAQQNAGSNGAKGKTGGSGTSPKTNKQRAQGFTADPSTLNPKSITLGKPSIGDQKGFQDYVKDKLKEGRLHADDVAPLDTGNELETAGQKQSAQESKHGFLMDFLLGDLADIADPSNAAVKGKRPDADVPASMKTHPGLAHMLNPFSSHAWMGHTPDEFYTPEGLNYIKQNDIEQKQAAFDSDNVTELGMPNLGVFSPGYGAEKLPGFIGETLRNTKVGKFFNPSAVEAELIKNQKILSRAPGRFEGVADNAGRKVKSFFGKKPSVQPSSLTGEQIENNFLNNLSEDLDHVFRRGGKLKHFDTGGAIEPYAPPAPGAMTPEEYTDIYGMAPSAPASVKDDWNIFNKPDGFYMDAVAPSSQRELSPVSEGSQGELQPGRGRNGRPVNWNGTLGDLVQYGVPAAYLAAEQHSINKLRNKAVPNLTAPELMTGAVQDLAHPDFTLPYRPEIGGSSLAEHYNNGIARDKFQREGELNWQLQNSENRMNQRNAVTDRTNQNIIQHTSIDNEKKSIAAHNAMYEFANLLQDRGQTAGSLFQNLNNGIFDAGVTRDARKMSQASTILRDPNSSREDRSWAETYLAETTGAPVRSRAKGGKMMRKSVYSC